MFEGSEKKLEIIFSPTSPSLFKQPLIFWKKVVRACGGEIISSLKSPKIHSYILSESSMFIWDHRLVLITCGKTALVKSFLKILNSFPKQAIEACFFQRKNEFFPQIQKSCFYKDVERIKKRLQGQAYRFGDLHDHHFFLFHSEFPSTPKEKDQTLEILIYDSEVFLDGSPNRMLHLKKIMAKNFSGFKLHEHFFTPLGYSLNAIKNHFYYTVHITPEEPSFYISFETNMQKPSVKLLTQTIINVFKPRRFDFILFEAPAKLSKERKKKILSSKDYFASHLFYKVLPGNYAVTYANFYKSKTKTVPPFLI